MALNSQYCWMLHVATVCTPCCMSLGVVASVWTPLPTRTQQLPTLLARQYWELLRPFGHHCQHGRYNSQHCWPDNIGSCCVRLDTTANTNATTPNIVGPTILGVVTSVWTPLPTRTLQLPTSLARQSWELLRLVARSLRRFPRPSHSCISVTHPLRPRDPKCTKPHENAKPVLFFCNMEKEGEFSSLKKKH